MNEKALPPEAPGECPRQREQQVTRPPNRGPVDGMGELVRGPSFYYTWVDVHASVFLQITIYSSPHNTCSNG